MLHKKNKLFKVLPIYFCIAFISMKFCSSEMITLHGPDDTIYTYDNSSYIGWGTRGIVYQGLCNFFEYQFYAFI